jgi:hypothetical protein
MTGLLGFLPFYVPCCQIAEEKAYLQNFPIPDGASDFL